MPTSVSIAAPTTQAMTQLTMAMQQALVWMKAHGGEVLLALAAGALIYTLLRLLRRWVRARAAAHPDSYCVGATILRTLARTRHFFLVMVALRLVTGYAETPALIDQTVRFLFIFAFALQVAIWAKEVVMTLVRQRATDGQNETLANALSLINVLVSIGLFAVAAIVVLDNVGVNVTGLIAGLGIGGIAIGLAAKGIFEDLFAALAIIFDRPFRTGDSIKFESTTATVERIGLKSTRLRALSGEQVVISNTQLLSKQIANFARVKKRRMSIMLSVAHNTPSDRLQAMPAVIEDVVNSHGGRFIRAGITQVMPAGLDFDVQFDVESEDYGTVFMARHAIAIALLDRLTAEGVVLSRTPPAA